VFTKIIELDPLRPETQKIRQAAAIIKKGGLVAFPTETVYGLGADAMNRKAALKIFKAKNRQTDNPLIVHICDYRQLGMLTEGVPRGFRKIFDKVWPGPVTFLLNKSGAVPDEVTAGSKKVAVRMPSHPIALALIRESGTPIAAPSANLSTRPSPTRAEHVIHDLNGRIDMVIDGGSTDLGIESTIVDLTQKKPRILRYGSYTFEELSKVIDGITRQGNAKTAGNDIVPGMKYRHYAPKTRLVVVRSSRLLLDSAERLSRSKKVCIICSIECAAMLRRADKIRMPIIELGSKKDAKAIAKKLFWSFRFADSKGADVCLMESFTRKGLGLSIMDRAMKASGNMVIAKHADIERYE
jgi:L-threonylcarbamoyladenylate synthase